LTKKSPKPGRAGQLFQWKTNNTMGQFTLNFDEPQAAPPSKKRSTPKRIAARPTQISSYYREKEDGKISKRAAQILELIAERGPMTGREIAETLGTHQSNLTAALKGLEELGKLVVRGERTNPVSGKRAMLYGLPDGGQ
jgi:CRP-like cAMP-binding protein